MTEEGKDRHLDGLLDSLLSGYSAVEPRPGLELRIRAGLKAHAAQRQWGWRIVAAVSAVFAIVSAVMTSAHRSKPAVSDHWAARITSADPGPRNAGVRTGTRAKPALHVASRVVSPPKNPSNQRLLQLANAMPAAGNLVFEQEKLYLSPEPQRLEEPASESETVPSIKLQDLVAPAIEIKDLPSVRNVDLKGSL
jgi:hypothetical protein